MSIEPKPTKGERKAKHALHMAGILLIGYLASVATKAPGELFAGFVAGLGTISGAFVYGNSKEHQADALKTRNQSQ